MSKHIKVNTAECNTNSMNHLEKQLSPHFVHPEMLLILAYPATGAGGMPQGSALSPI